MARIQKLAADHFYSCLPFDSEFPMINENRDIYNGTRRTDMFGSAES